MSKIFKVLFFTFAVLPFYAHAAGLQRVGAWMVSSEKDPFSSKTKTIAGTISQSISLVIRCFGDDGLSVILVNNQTRKNYSPGDKVDVKYRADEGDIVDVKGEAFGESSIELPNAAQILKDAQKAKALFLRVGLADESIVTLSFEMQGAPKALQKIQADCGQ